MHMFSHTGVWRLMCSMHACSLCACVPPWNFAFHTVFCKKMFQLFFSSEFSRLLNYYYCQWDKIPHCKTDLYTVVSGDQFVQVSSESHFGLMYFAVFIFSSIGLFSAKKNHKLLLLLKTCNSVLL